MARSDDQNFDKPETANGATILGWVIAPAMLLATLYISGMGPMIGAPSNGQDSASTTHNVTQVFSVRYID